MTNLLSEEIDGLLRPLAPVLAKEADALLDLRELLMNQGHPGKCVRCFFRLFEAAGPVSGHQLAPLRAWLEKNVEISVHGDGTELETLPFLPAQNEDLASFCLRSISRMRLDRGHRARRLDLSFRYKNRAA